MQRRRLTQGLAAAWAVGGLPALAAGQPQADAAAAGVKVLRYAFSVAETSFDPAQISDLYSRTSPPHLRRAANLRPSRAAVQAQAADGRGDARGVGRLPHLHDPHPARHLLRRRSGVQGQPARARRRGLRLLVQAHRRPEAEEPGQSALEEEGIVGLQELRDEAVRTKKPFDYDSPVEGLRALDRYTLRVQAARAATALPRDLGGARHLRRGRARGGRVLRRRDHGASGGHRAVPARGMAAQLAHRARAQPRLPRARSTTPSRTPTTPRGRRLLKRFQGRRLPMIDRVEISIIEQSQPRWLSFVNGEQDVALPGADRVRRRRRCPSGKVAPEPRARGRAGLVARPAATSR